MLNPGLPISPAGTVERHRAVDTSMGASPGSAGLQEPIRFALDPALRAELGPLLQMLYDAYSDGLFSARGDIEEVCIQVPGEVWIAHPSKGFSRHQVPGLDRVWMGDFCAAVSAQTGAPFSADLPMISAELPGGHRLQAIVGANVARTGMAMSIRVQRKIDYSLELFLGKDRPPAESSSDGPGRTPEEEPSIGGSLVDDVASHVVPESDMSAAERLLVRAIANGNAVMFSGSTNSGKTSLLRSLMRYIPPAKRIVTFEDMPEIQLTHANQVGLLAQGSDLSRANLVKSVLRFRPDVVLAGEIQSEEAYEIFRLLISGHAAFMTTIHAGNPREAVDAWLTAMAMSGANESALASAGRALVRAIDLIVQIGPGREICELARPDESWVI